MDNDESIHPTRWVVITPNQLTKTFASEEEAIDWIDDLWSDRPHIDSVKLMRIERYTTIIYRPRSGKPRRK